MNENPTTVADLRVSLGELASDPLISLQLQELEVMERIKNETIPFHEQRAEEISDARDAVKLGLEVIANYAKYNQRWNDTIKTLMAIMKSKARVAAVAVEVKSPFTKEQEYLLGVAHGKEKRGSKK